MKKASPRQRESLKLLDAGWCKTFGCWDWTSTVNGRCNKCELQMVLPSTSKHTFWINSISFERNSRN